MSQRLEGLNALTENYGAILCDVWGVIHNGRDVYHRAAQALAEFRKQGGKVVLITNSPRRNQGVLTQLNEMGVQPDAYDAIVTSGDVTRNLISEAKGPVFHLGPSRDMPLFDELDVEMSDEAECAAIVCTGLFDDEAEEPEDYRDRLNSLAKRNVPFICANPDLVVERGDRLVYCAGSLAKLYEELGGETRVAGKPHAPIYKLARERLAEISGGPFDEDRIIAIGDGMPTDVAGAQNNGVDLLYISAGIHHTHYGNANNPDEAALNDFLNENNATPNYWMPRLWWEAQ